MLLDMLYDLTRADGSSLGATAGEEISKRYGWSHWRESLVRAMYSAAREIVRYRLKVAMPTLTSVDDGYSPAASRARTTTRSCGMYS